MKKGKIGTSSGVQDRRAHVYCKRCQCYVPRKYAFWHDGLIKGYLCRACHLAIIRS